MTNPEHLSDLPFWLQALAGAGIFVGGFGAAVLGWVKKNWNNSLAEKESGSKDAVILSASIADSQAVNNLATAITQLVKVQTSAGEDQQMLLHRIDSRLEDIRLELERVTKVLREKAIV